jgi:hypothetical protein
MPTVVTSPESGAGQALAAVARAVEEKLGALATAP